MNLKFKARKTMIYRLVLMLAVAASGIGTASAQTVVYDWSKNAKVPDQYPTIRRRETVTFRIENVNDILFSYKLKVFQQSSESDDFKTVAGLFNIFSPKKSKNDLAALRDSETLSCSDREDLVNQAVQGVIQEIGDDAKLPAYYATHPPPSTMISLDDSKHAWANHQTAIENAKSKMQDYRDHCPRNETLENAFAEFKRVMEKIDANVNKPEHIFIGKAEISPGNDVTVDVTEFFDSTEIQTKEFKFSRGDVLTLSAGALFSTIQDRSYDSRKSPTSTLNLLTVEGNSRATPGVVALLNYSLGALGLDGDSVGLALSAGPVIKFGGKSDTSSFGFFTGISTHLYHRFYITPGFHFGQFADFPVGFGNGSTIPANFGELTPVKRWTAKFGLAITFKTKDFSSLTSSSGTPTVKTEEGGSSPGPSSSPSPSSSPNGDSANRKFQTPNNDIARSFLRSTTQKSAKSDVGAIEDQNRNSGSDFINARGVTSIATSARYIVAPERSAVNNISSISAESEQNSDRIILISHDPVTDYSVYFKASRFYVVIANASLDLFQDDLIGRRFNDPIVEKRRGDLVISFALASGTKVHIEQGSTGLEIVFINTANR